jgi:hypothetical protein
MRRALSLVAVAAALGGCSDRASGGMVSMMPDYTLPSESMRDWVSFGDQLSVIRVLDETAPKLPRDWKNSGGLIGRTVTVRVDGTLWHRRQGPRLRGDVRMQVWGWMMDSDQEADSPRRPIASVNAPRLEVGRRYLAVLTKLRGDWIALNDEAVMTLAGDTVTSEVPEGEPSEPAAALKGKTIDEAGAIVAAARPYPEAAAHPQASPVRRMRLVYAG